MSAIISSCELYRYRLDRKVQDTGLVFAYFGVNPSTADAMLDDATVRKWKGFTLRNGGRRFIVGNAFGFRTTDVKSLDRATNPYGPDNERYVRQIIEEADILVPCWGNEKKVPERLRYGGFNVLRSRIFASGKPVKIFGLTSEGYPKHPLMLGYDTPLIDYPGYTPHPRPILQGHLSLPQTGEE